MFGQLVARGLTVARFVQALANAQKEILFTRLLILAAPLPQDELRADVAAYEAYAATEVPEAT